MWSGAYAHNSDGHPLQGHPNDKGHLAMFGAIDVEAVVELARSTPPREGTVWTRKSPKSWLQSTETITHARSHESIISGTVP